jgi:hypothetical protein
MTEPWAAQLAIVERPRLPLAALYVLRGTIIGALLSLSPANMLDSSPISPQIQTEVTSLLKLLMAEHIAADVALPVETANE